MCLVVLKGVVICKCKSIQVCTVVFLQSAHHYDVCFRLCPSLQFFFRVTCTTVSARSMFTFRTWHRCDFSFPLDEWVYLLHVSYPLSDVLGYLVPRLARTYKVTVQNYDCLVSSLRQVRIFMTGPPCLDIGR